jgi:hypothetical protein
MEPKTRSAVVSGAVLIALGVVFLVLRVVPGLFETLTWPWIIIGVGALFLVLSLVTVTPGLAVPGCIIGGIGLILWWQNRTGEWWTWSFAWTLIPGFVGVGVLVSGLLEGRPLKAIMDAIWPIIVSVVLFVIFASSFGAFSWSLGFWPIAGIVLIAVGVLVILRPLLGKLEKTGKQKEE